MKVIILIAVVFMMICNNASTDGNPYNPKNSVIPEDNFKNSRNEIFDNIHEHETLPMDVESKDSDVIVCADKELKNFPCPEVDDIHPCVCSVDEEYQLRLNCSKVEGDEQLAHVFQQHFPVPQFREFYIVQNDHIRTIKNIFNNVSFEEVHIAGTEIMLVSDYALLDSKDTLTSIIISGGHLDSDTFPLMTLSQYSLLKTLYLENSNFTWLPPLQSESISLLSFSGSYISTLESDVFHGTPNVHFINLSSNNITALSTGTFVLPNDPATIDLHSNAIRDIQAGIFVLPPTTDSLSVNLYLENNEIMFLEQRVFGEVFPFVRDFFVTGNPLACECDIAWIVLNATYLLKVNEEATCSDGQNIHELDTSYYQEFC